MISVLSARLGTLSKGLGDLLSYRHVLSSLISSMENRNRNITEVRWCSKSSSSVNRPKRPLTSFFRFSIEQRPIFKKQNPDLKSLELIKKIAFAWNELPVSEKKPYEMAAAAEGQIYKEEMARFKAQLTPEQTATLKKEKMQRLAKKKSIGMKRALTILGKPKRPRNSVNIFIAEHFNEAKGISFQENMKNLMKEWNKLQNSQKQLYMQLAEDDKVRYENEIAVWEKQMIEVGREDLIRFKQREIFEKQRKAKRRKAIMKTISDINSSKLEKILKSNMMTSKPEKSSTPPRKAEE
uniref:Transcription factor A, mitochondrial isoform X2 n=1 Tax=Geotrypetes seraphini TaxID=260995 RepID=A0A6P8QKS9_GEOSA|nr:transcription factor A, mitochondrial isoform X2 [Geotrypetes seraphini]